MDYIPGKTLDQIARGYRLHEAGPTHEEAVRSLHKIMVEMIFAIIHANQNQLLLGDIHQNNIVISDHAVFVDFDATVKRKFLGDIPYVCERVRPPEYDRALTHAVSDFYALGRSFQSITLGSLVKNSSFPTDSDTQTKLDAMIDFINASTKIKVIERYNALRVWNLEYKILNDKEFVKMFKPGLTEYFFDKSFKLLRSCMNVFR